MYQSIQSTAKLFLVISIACISRGTDSGIHRLNSKYFEDDALILTNLITKSCNNYILPVKKSQSSIL